MSNEFLKTMKEGETFSEEKVSTAKLDQLYGPLRAKVNESITKQEKCLAEVEVNIAFYGQFIRNLVILFLIMIYYKGTVLVICFHSVKNKPVQI